MLPHESHGYRARESVMHMAWEMTAWLDKHVKDAKEARTGTQALGVGCGLFAGKAGVVKIHVQLIRLAAYPASQST